MSPLEFIVEPQKLANEPRPQLKGRVHAGGQRLIGGRPTTHQPLNRPQQRRRCVRSPMQLCVKLVPREQQRQHLGGSRVERPLLKRPPQLVRGGMRRHDDRGRATVPRAGLGNAGENRQAKGRQIRGAEQPRLSGRDHVNSRKRIRTQRGPLSECTSFHEPRRYGPSDRAVSQPVEKMWTACGSPVDRQGAQNFSLPAPRRRRRDRPPCAPIFALSFAVADTCQVTRIPLVLVAIINPTPAR